MEQLKTDDFEVIVGTYEEFLLGYKLKEGEQGNDKLELTFTNHSHSGSIRAVAVVGRFLASGSTDEAIRLINMKKRAEHGYLQQQSGTITCLTNFGTKFLFSGSSDGTICIWRTKGFICEKTLVAHKGGVVDVSVHPSGKLALSVGMDRSLKTWNLIKGRTGYVTNLHGVGDCVQWSPEGGYYAVGVSNRLDVYSTGTAKVIYSIQFGKRVGYICFTEEDIVIVGGDKDIIEVHNIKESRKLSEFKAHQTRVKGVQYISQHQLLVTSSNCDQMVKLWRFQDGSFEKAPTILTQYDTTCRVTCFTAWSKSIADSHAELDTEGDELVEIANAEDDSQDQDMEVEEPQPKTSQKKNTNPKNAGEKASAPKKKKRKA